MAASTFSECIRPNDSRAGSRLSPPQKRKCSERSQAKRSTWWHALSGILLAAKATAKDRPLVNRATGATAGAAALVAGIGFFRFLKPATTGGDNPFTSTSQSWATPPDAVSVADEFGGSGRTLSFVAAAGVGVIVAIVVAAALLASIALYQDGRVLLLIRSFKSRAIGEELRAELVARSRRCTRGVDDTRGKSGAEPLLSEQELRAHDLKEEDWSTADEAALPPESTHAPPQRNDLALLRRRGGFRARGRNRKRMITEAKDAASAWTGILVHGVELHVNGQLQIVRLRRPENDSDFAPFTEIMITPISPADPIDDDCEPEPAPEHAQPIVLQLLGIGLGIKGNLVTLSVADDHSTNEIAWVIMTEVETEALELYLCLRVLRAAADTGAGVLDWGERPRDCIERLLPAE